MNEDVVHLPTDDFWDLTDWDDYLGKMQDEVNILEGLFNETVLLIASLRTAQANFSDKLAAKLPINFATLMEFAERVLGGLRYHIKCFSPDQFGKTLLQHERDTYRRLNSYKELHTKPLPTGPLATSSPTKVFNLLFELTYQLETRLERVVEAPKHASTVTVWNYTPRLYKGLPRVMEELRKELWNIYWPLAKEDRATEEVLPEQVREMLWYECKGYYYLESVNDLVFSVDNKKRRIRYSGTIAKVLHEDNVLDGAKIIIYELTEGSIVPSRIKRTKPQIDVFLEKLHKIYPQLTFQLAKRGRVQWQNTGS